MNTYTVIGVWLSDEPVSTGVIEGRHNVTGGDEGAFPEGVWAVSVEADDPETAESIAVEEMEENL